MASNRWITPWGQGRPYLIAEFGLTHEGSLGNAMCMVDAAKAAGADAVKFQDHWEDINNAWRDGVKHPQDAARQDYWCRTGFIGTEWATLRSHASNIGIHFGITPFSEMALGRCKTISPDFLKISRQYAGTSLHDAALATGIPTLHTGEGGLTLDGYEPGDLGISVHSGDIDKAKAALYQGAQVLELHVCFSRQQFGPDVPFSITFDDLADLVWVIDHHRGLHRKANA